MKSKLEIEAEKYANDSFDMLTTNAEYAAHSHGFKAGAKALLDYARERSYPVGHSALQLKVANIIDLEAFCGEGE